MKRSLFGVVAFSTVAVASYALGSVAGGWFVAGSGGPRSEPAASAVTRMPSTPMASTPAAPTKQPVVDSPAERAPQRAMAAPQLEVAGTVLERPAFEEWEAFVRTSPGTAAALHDAVIDVIVARQAQGELESCFSSADVGGASTLRFAVDVRVAGGELIVGDAKFVSVLDGDQVESPVGACVEARLSGAKRVVTGRDLGGYAGRVEYTVAVGRRAAQR